MRTGSRKIVADVTANVWSDEARAAALEARRGSEHADGDGALARDASKKAMESGSAEDHFAASKAHLKAAKQYKASGDAVRALKHSNLSESHREAAVDAGRPAGSGSAYFEKTW